MNIDNWTKDHKSLLLYLETRAVDHGGKVSAREMNDIDRQIIEEWKASGFIQYGRLAFECCDDRCCTWVRLPDEAFQIAHRLRRERAERMWKNRNWYTTQEKKEARAA